MSLSSPSESINTKLLVSSFSQVLTNEAHPKREIGMKTEATIAILSLISGPVSGCASR